MQSGPRRLRVGAPWLHSSDKRRSRAPQGSHSLDSEAITIKLQSLLTTERCFFALYIATAQWQVSDDILELAPLNNVLSLHRGRSYPSLRYSSANDFRHRTQRFRLSSVEGPSTPRKTLIRLLIVSTGTPTSGHTNEVSPSRRTRSCSNLCLANLRSHQKNVNSLQSNRFQKLLELFTRNLAALAWL